MIQDNSLSTIKLIAVIVVSYNSKQDLKSFFESFIEYNESTNINFYIIETGINHDFTDIEVDFGNKVNLSINYMNNKGYGAACNYGYSIARTSGADIYIFSNPDIVFNCDIVDRVRSEFSGDVFGTIIQKNPSKNKCTFDLYPQFKSILTEALKIHKLINLFNFYNPKFVHIVGAFMIFGKDILDSVDLFDESFFLYYEETDLYFRIRNKFKFVIINDIYITHNVSTSIDKSIHIDKFKIQFDSLHFYSVKHCDFKYYNSLLKLYRITSIFKKTHRIKLEYMLNRSNRL